MNYKKWMAALLAVLLMAGLVGCQLALPDMATGQNGDRLIGALVTSEHLNLFDVEGYLQQNLNRNLNGFSGGEIKLDGNTKAFEERLYATLKEETLTSDEDGHTRLNLSYVFEELEASDAFVGAFYAPRMEQDGESYNASVVSGAMADVKLGIRALDTGSGLDLEGTVYMDAKKRNIVCYINPVYQDGDGRVYLMGGSGISWGGESGAGGAFTQTLTENTTHTENGTTTTQDTAIEISIKTVLVPQSIVVLQMSDENQVLERIEYAPGTLPETLVPLADTAYILVETYTKADTGEVTAQREIFSQDDEALFTFLRRDDGICTKAQTGLDWPE